LGRLQRAETTRVDANFHEFLAAAGRCSGWLINTDFLTAKLANAMKREGGSNGDMPISRTPFRV
jgi:hypothetical protein